MNDRRKKLHPTRHAQQAMKDRDITWPEVVTTVNKPERVYSSRDCLVYQSPAIAIVVAPDGAVVSVLLRRDPETIERNRWSNEDAVNRSRA